MDTIIAQRKNHFKEIRSQVSNVFELTTFAKKLEADGKSEHPVFVYDMAIDLFNYHPYAYYSNALYFYRKKLPKSNPISNANFKDRSIIFQG